MSSSPPVFTWCVTSGASHQGISREVDSEEAARGDLERLLGTHPDAEVLRIEHVHRGTSYFVKRGGRWRHTFHVLRGLSEAEMDAEEAAFEAKAKAGPRTFVGTFRKGHYHPTTGQSLHRARVVFQAASVHDANDLMWDAFGDEGWWDARELEDVRRTFRKGGLTEEQIDAELWSPPYFKVAWPGPVDDPGETVTLRVRITQAQAAESEVWIGRRCLLHRASPEVSVLPGVGVEAEDGEWHEPWREGPKTKGVSCAGTTFLVRFFARADAERAAEADPENVSIVADSVSLGTFRRPPKVMKDEPSPVKSRIKVSGTFTLDMLYALAEDPSFRPVYVAARDAWDAVGADAEPRVFAVELRDNRVVAVHVTPPEAI